MSRRRELALRFTSPGMWSSAVLITSLCACSAASGGGGCPDGGVPDLAVSGFSLDIGALKLPTGSAVRLEACEVGSSVCGDSSLTLHENTPSSLPVRFAFAGTAEVTLSVSVEADGKTVVKQDVAVTPRSVDDGQRPCVQTSLHADLRISGTEPHLVIEQVAQKS